MIGLFGDERAKSGNISQQHDEKSDERAESEATREKITKQSSFLTGATGRSRGDDESWRGDHLAHDAAHSIRRAHENGRYANLPGCDRLQASEEHIRGGIGAGGQGSQPSYERSEKGVQAMCVREGKANGSVNARVAADEPESQHGSDGNDGKANAVQGLFEAVHEYGGSYSDEKSGEDRSDHAGCACGAEPVEREDGRFCHGMRHDRRCSVDMQVQTGDGQVQCCVGIQEV